MKDLQVLEHSGIRVMTTEQLAEAYGCDVQHIKQNFNNNKDRFAEGKHYLRYMGYRSWAEIATEMKLGVRQIYRLHGVGLKNIFPMSLNVTKWQSMSS